MDGFCSGTRLTRASAVSRVSPASLQMRTRTLVSLRSREVSLPNKPSPTPRLLLLRLVFVSASVGLGRYPLPYPCRHSRACRHVGLARSILAWLCVARCQLPFLEEKPACFQFSFFGILISTRFCQLSNRKITSACHKPHLAKRHVDFRVFVLPRRAPRAT